jgi:MFS family permease
MAVEIAASRMMAQYIGAGLYVWTSVIGVVLGGMSAGNLAGGRIADRFDPRRTLALLLIASAVACLGVPLADHWAGRWFQWEFPSQTSFPLRVAAHVAIVLVPPAFALGLVGPAVARLALLRGVGAGRVMGSVGAWGALGSIGGTFLAGYWLIAAVGTSGVALGAAAALAAAGVAISPRGVWPVLAASWPAVVGLAGASFLVAGLGVGEWKWVDGRITVRERGKYDRIWERDGHYSFVRVAEDLEKAGTRGLLLDFLLHAQYVPADDKKLVYEYERLYASLTERLGKDRSGLRSLILGGGGYTFPRYFRERWPEGLVQVAEIDPVVTEANFAAFGLKPEDVRIVRGPGSERGVAGAEAPPRPPGRPRPMEVYHLDAGNHVDDLARQRESGQGFEPFDFIYGDAYNDFFVPFHLVTLEFTRKLRDILRPGTGVYLMNVIDIFDAGEFLGAVYNTVRAVFPHVYVYSSLDDGPSPEPTRRDTFIVVGALQPLDLAGLGTRPGEQAFTGSLFRDEHLRLLVERSRGIVLTDDYAPVETLLDKVVRRRTLKTP